MGADDEQGDGVGPGAPDETDDASESLMEQLTRAGQRNSFGPAHVLHPRLVEPPEKAEAAELASPDS